VTGRKQHANGAFDIRNDPERFAAQPDMVNVQDEN
jgi:hypothetical protein